jgi:hypothetical protein
MTNYFSIFVLFFSLNSFAQTTGTNTAIHSQEKIENQKAADRNEQANTNNALQPNQKSAPTRIDTSSWGLSDTKFEITNHLLGYSTILDDDRTLNGIKITGIVNFAYYNVTEKNQTPGERSKSRYVFGVEFPMVELTNRITFWGGIGGSLGDAKGLYADLGLDFIALNWFKLQGGANYNSDTGVAPQLSLGFVW